MTKKVTKKPIKKTTKKKTTKKTTGTRFPFTYYIKESTGVLDIMYSGSASTYNIAVRKGMEDGQRAVEYCKAEQGVFSLNIRTAKEIYPDIPIVNRFYTLPKFWWDINCPSFGTMTWHPVNSQYCSSVEEALECGKKYLEESDLDLEKKYVINVYLVGKKEPIRKLGWSRREPAKTLEDRVNLVLVKLCNRGADIYREIKILEQERQVNEDIRRDLMKALKIGSAEKEKKNDEE